VITRNNNEGYVALIDAWKANNVSRVCGVATIVHPLKVECKILSGKYGETRNSCLLSVKYGMGVAT